MTDESQLTKDELQRRIESAWTELMDSLAELDDAALSRVDGESGWAIKDHLFHLAAWERGIAFLLTGRSRVEGMGISAEQWRDLTMDEINSVLYQTNRQRSASEAMAQAHVVHEDMMAALASMDDADLRRDYAEFDPNVAATGRPIIGWIIGDTYEHYREHLEYIREGSAG